MDQAASGAGEWGPRAMAWLQARPQGTELTSEDLTRAVGMPPGPKAVGAIIAAASRAGTLVAVGVQEAERPERHAGLNRVWRRA